MRILLRSSHQFRRSLIILSTSGRSRSTFSFARWRIVEVVNDVLVPVIWSDMDALRVCVFPNRYQEVC